MAEERVAVTGIGLVTPLGATRETTWSRLQAGEPGVRRLQRIDCRELPCPIGGEVLDDVATRSLDAADGRSFPLLDYAYSSINEAAIDAGYGSAGELADRAPIVVGTHGVFPNAAEIERLGALGPEERERQRAIYRIDFVVKALGELLGCAADITSVTTACSSGASAISEAAELVASGEADTAVACGVDTCVNELQILAFDALDALAKNLDPPDRAVRPFDALRTGFAFSDGACALILSSERQVAEMGRKPYGYVSGWSSLTATSHLTTPDPTGQSQALCMQRCLEAAGRSSLEVRYVNAHGTGTLDNDRTECIGIRSLLGRHTDDVPVSSTKGALGHMIGASGAAEAAFALLAMRDGHLPGNRNLEHPDPDCEVGLLGADSESWSPGLALSNSFGLAGSYVTLALEPAESRS